MIGPNGSGKTTLIRHLATSRAPARGSVHFEGRRVDARWASHADLTWYRAQLGYMPQQVGLYPNLTQAQFVHYIAELKGIPVGPRGAAIGAALRTCGLDPECDKPLGRKSEGTRRRAALAAALVGCPRVLLLDEPMISCDPVERARIKSALRSMGTATTCVISASSIADVDRLCDELIVLDKGRIVFAGRPEDLVDMAQGSVFAGKLLDFTLGQLNAAALSMPGPTPEPTPHRQTPELIVTGWVGRSNGAEARLVVRSRDVLPSAAEGVWREAEPSLEEAYL